MEHLKTPLHAWHTGRKARMVPFGGWDMPVQYTGIIDEHRAVRTGAGIFDVSHMARLSFSGADTATVLQRVYTNDISKMKDGQVRYGLICNADGGTRDDVLVYRWPYGWAMVVNAGNREKITAWLKEQSAGLDFAVHDQTFTTAMIAVQGPRSVAVCADLFADPIADLGYYFAKPTRYQDRPAVVSRTGYTGEDGFELMVSAEQAPELCDTLVARGAVPCGLGARDTLRLEAAMPLYGHELTETINPIQAGLGWAVKLAKGDFIGRAALEKAVAEAARSPQRIGLELEGKRAAREGSTVLDAGGRTVGTVTSGSYVPGLERSIAMAYVEPASAVVGGKLVVDIRGSAVPAQVTAMPFYKRAK